MEEMRGSRKAKFTNRKLMDTGLRQEFYIIVVAIKREGEEMMFNPRP